MYPLKLAASWREKIWGSTDLTPLFGRQDRRIGEIWYTFEENTITNGPWAGQTLGALMDQHGAALMGAAYRPTGLRRRSTGEITQQDSSAAKPYFPILVKFLFTSDDLSVQVHPDDDYALRHEGGPGKTEMWYILRADPGASVALGLTEPLPPDRLRSASLSGEIQRFMKWVPVRPGDAVFSPPGTLHAIGKGLALCEIQQNSDLTYRLYDYGRLGDDGKPRELHLDRGIEVTKVDPHPGVLARTGESVVRCPYFAVDRLQIAASTHYDPDPDRLHILVFLEGRGVLGSEPYEAGDVYLIPASLASFDWLPAEPTLALRAFVPES